jgi:glycosyltransferase involved in cell wall biosynthesis
MITVILPSFARDTLNRSLQSLINQTNPNWSCQLGLDGYSAPSGGSQFLLSGNQVPFPLLQDSRIKTTYIPQKLGNKYYRQVETGNGQGGLVRNILIDKADTEWITFLDDDDTFHPECIQRCYDEINQGGYDCYILKRAYDPGYQQVIPPRDCTELELGKVSTSFLVNVGFLRQHGIIFVNDKFEDYIYAKMIESAGGRIKFSEHITYHVEF